MNTLSSKQRKMTYILGIVVLLVPIIWLGMPSSGDAGAEARMGQMAKLRQEYDLGETSLGDVDPTSATMNLVLLGMRGVAASLLSVELDEQKNQKQWAQMRATTESIIMLQPHFKSVWEFHGWNLAYNVSAEWDGVADRYYWVKEGAKFTMRGSARNRRYPELYWHVGRMLGQKVGRSDEWVQFRKFFLNDPQREDGGVDPEINPQGLDNYLAAKEWFIAANAAEDLFDQHLQMRMLFRSYPQRAQFDYAGVLQREGKFDEVTRIAWEAGYDEWTTDYGRTEFQAPGTTIVLEATRDDIIQLAKKNGVDESLVEHWVDRYQKTSNYNYWRTRALSESEPNTTEAHRELYVGKTAFEAGDLETARVNLESGMQKFGRLMQLYPTLQSEDETLEEALWAVMIWRHIFRLEHDSDEPFPAVYPLKQVWDANQERVGNLQYEFDRKLGN